MQKIKFKVARLTLEKARFFLERAKECLEQGERDRLALTCYIEATITFARSVTFHLQREGRNSLGDIFDEWYNDAIEKACEENPEFKFFSQVRNCIVHEGPVPLTYEMYVIVNMPRPTCVAAEFRTYQRENTGKQKLVKSVSLVSSQNPKESVEKAQNASTISEEIFICDESGTKKYPFPSSLENYLSKLENFIKEGEEYLNEKLKQ